jgi:hypothetical protein
MQVTFLKTPNNVLVPMDEEASAQTAKWKSGAVVRGDFREMRNGRFFRKWWTLVAFAFDVWADLMPALEVNGREVRPNFERFRKDLIVMCGFYEPVWNIKGELRLEPRSLRWAQMEEKSFDELYQKTINVILEKILSGHGYSEEMLRKYVDTVLAYA